MVKQRGKSGVWYARIETKDATGKRRQKWVRLDAKNERQAKKEEVRLITEREAGTLTKPTRQTVAEFLRIWITGHKTQVQARTWERYQELIEKNLIPQLGHIALSKLQPEDIRAAYSRMGENGRCRGQGGLSRRTVQHCHRVLRKALKQAVEDNRLLKNPCDFERAKPPKVERPEMAVLDEGQTARLLQAAEGHWLRLPILLAVGTGMRRNEILGLRWEDVDLQAGVLSVTQTMEQTREKGIDFKTPKTPKSRRAIALPPLLVEALREHRRQEGRVKGLVFIYPDGRPRTPTSLTRSFTKLVARLEIPRVRFHDLRHGHATQLLKERIHVKVVSERLGHSTIAITLDTYSHVLPGMQEEAAQKIDAALRRAIGGG